MRNAVPHATLCNTLMNPIKNKWFSWHWKGKNFEIEKLRVKDQNTCLAVIIDLSLFLFNPPVSSSSPFSKASSQRSSSFFSLSKRELFNSNYYWVHWESTIESWLLPQWFAKFQDLCTQSSYVRVIEICNIRFNPF